MAFCNSCGATLDTGAKFCNKCGATQPETAAATPAPSAPVGSAVPAKGGSSALKIILIVVAVVVGLGIIGVSAVSYMAYRIAKGTHVEESNGRVKMETPFGKIESSTDSDAAAHDIGIDPYPGSEPVKGGSSTMNIGSMSTVSVQLITDDPPAKVAEYYKDHLSNVTYSGSQGDQYTMMAGDKNDMTTVTIAPEEGRTHIVVSKVTKK